MIDENYWKIKYKPKWGQSSRREVTIQHILEKETGKKVNIIGMGAGSTEFIPGSADTHGYNKGDADLEIEGTNILIEVTGPLTDKVNENAALWVRPDKINNAKKKRGDFITWVVHHLTKTDLLRTIKFDEDFFEKFDKGVFPVINPSIEGSIETYIEIKANDTCVKTFDELIHFIKDYKV